MALSMQRKVAIGRVAVGAGHPGDLTDQAKTASADLRKFLICGRYISSREHRGQTAFSSVYARLCMPLTLVR
uniref:Proline dehydrogenase n=1 Tax=Ascaris lumbricoides TaxID=6252 RepID=A0A0M3I4U8_ASCLU